MEAAKVVETDEAANAADLLSRCSCKGRKSAA